MGHRKLRELDIKTSRVLQHCFFRSFYLLEVLAGRCPRTFKLCKPQNYCLSDSCYAQTVTRGYSTAICTYAYPSSNLCCQQLQHCLVHSANGLHHLLFLGQLSFSCISLLRLVDLFVSLPHHGPLPPKVSEHSFAVELKPKQTSHVIIMVDDQICCGSLTFTL